MKAKRGFGNKERPCKMRDRAAIAEKAYRSHQIAAAAGDTEVLSKYRELNDTAAFWAWIAATCRRYRML